MVTALRVLVLFPALSIQAAMAGPIATNAAGREADYFTLPIRYGTGPGFKPTPENEFRIPRKPGPTADATLIALGERLAAVDRRIGDASAGGTLSTAQINALLDARNLTMRDLMEGQRILATTSGGELPNKTKASVEGWLDQIVKGLSSVPRHDNVASRVRYVKANPDIAVLFQSYAQFADGSKDWSTYTVGQDLKVGTYLFKVRSLSSARECTESVLVLADPTERAICGAFKP